MITRIEIDGFKSLRGFALDLEPFMAFVGPNGAGKSNVFDALGLLQRLTSSDIATALSKGRGRMVDQFSRGQTTADPVRGWPQEQMTLALEFLLPEPSWPDGLRPAALMETNRVRYLVGIQRLEYPSGAERLLISHEYLMPIAQKSDLWMNRHPRLAPLATYVDQRAPLMSYGNDGQNVSLHFYPKPIRLQMTPGSPLLFSPHYRVHSPYLTAVAQELEHIALLQLDPQKLREPSERGARPDLGADGLNLPAVLLDQPPEVLAKIRADISQLLPGIRDFEILRDQDWLYLEVETADGQRYPSQLLSDGTLRLMGLLTVLRSQQRKSLIGLEEPENGIHPKRLRTLLAKLWEMTSNVPALGAPQVLVTSHSPVMLTSLLDHPENLAAFDLVRESQGFRKTRVRRVVPQRQQQQDQNPLNTSTREMRAALEHWNTDDPMEI